MYPSRGGKAWIKISDDDVAFHDLLGRNHAYEDEDEEPTMTIRDTGDELGQILGEALSNITSPNGDSDATPEH